METLPDMPTPHDLLRDTSWLESIARRLAADDDEAHDVAQDIWLKTRDIAVPSANPGAWLHGAVRNLVHRGFRTRARRRRREVAAARPERVEADPAALALRAELYERVARSVLDLEEPYRSTVLYRYFEDLGPGEIAKRTGVGAATVSTRIHRALAQLRSRLDASYAGSRGAWTALFPIAWRPESTAGAAASATSTLPIATGAYLVAQKSAITIGVASVLALGAGVGVGTWMHEEPPPLRGRDGRSLAQSDVDDLEARLASSITELAETRSTRSTLAAERDEFARRVAELERRVEEIETPAADEPAVAVAPPVETLPVSYGNYAELEGFRDADWKNLGSVLSRMNDLMATINDSIESGKPLPPDVAREMGRENASLVQFAAQLVGKLPTNIPINGEFTHPAATTNLLASLLEHLELPLEDEQRDALARLGEDYDRELARTSEEYDEATPRLRRIIDELALKRGHIFGLRDILSEEQRSAIYDPRSQDYVQLDLFSPAIGVTGLVSDVQVADLAEARVVIERDLTQRGLDDTQIAAAASILDQWMADLEPVFRPERPLNRPSHLDDVILAGEAQSRAIERLLEMPGLTDEAREQLHEEMRWLLPRAKPPAAAKGSE